MFKTNFDERILEKKIGTKSRADYSVILDRLLELENDNSLKKQGNDYKNSKKYDVLVLNVEGVTVHKLVKKGTNLRYVCSEVCY
jgi:hypothetical protein